MLWRTSLLTLVLGAVAVAQSGGAPGKKPAKSSSAAPATHAAASTGDKTVARPKSFDLGAMDKSVNPCEDFYPASSLKRPQRA